MRQNPLIEVRNVAVEFSTKSGPTQALSYIDFTVGAGEFVMLVGPSGCGKSTLLRALAGFVFPSSGEVFVGNEPVRGPHYSRGVVFQQPNLYPWLSAEGNVAFGLKARGVPAKERAETVKTMLELVGLWGARGQFPYELSGGMQQRISIARSLANHPAILLMDEPFSALDDFTRKQLQEELKTIWSRSGQTVIFVTHNVAEAIFLSTTVFVMAAHPGRIVETLHPPFSRRDSSTKVNQVQSEPDFIRLQNHVIDLIENAHG